MIVKQIRVYGYSQSLRRDFSISYDTISAARGVIVELITDEGIKGFGEATPSPKITGSTLDSILSAIKMIAERIVGRELSPQDMQTLYKSIKHNSEAKASVEIALLDAWSKKLKTPLYRLLGGSRKTIITDMTIGLMKIESALREAQAYVDKGFRILKIKLGESPEKDVEKIKKMREALGYDITLRVDANQAWSFKDALKILKKLEKYEVELVEQPLPGHMLREHVMLRKATTIPIALDESVHNLNDAYEAVNAEAADIINIKLMKTGGIIEAIKITHLSEAAAIENMVGCMVETTLGITAAAHFAAASPNVRYIDLDSDLMLLDSPVEGGARHTGGGVRVLPDDPGLGVRVEEDKLKLLHVHG